ncbi:MAG: hypothetical protein PHY80_01975, partial [Rickettsiales bacterium]|nr:hypothetical protein [Rickettsiales bacterium]
HYNYKPPLCVYRTKERLKSCSVSYAAAYTGKSIVKCLNLFVKLIYFEYRGVVNNKNNKIKYF